MNKPDIYLIDASIYIFKNYYSNDNYTSAKGESINAVYGFTRFLTNFIHQTKATHIACAFDESLDTSYRNEIYPKYKANRDPAPDDLKWQFKLCQEVAKVMGIATYCDGYYEADDLIGTLANHHHKLGHNNHIVSADKDLAQLVKGEYDTWWDYGKAPACNNQKVFEKYGVYPNQIADFLALTGDAVDNIPGVPGIGAKSAAYLLNHFKTLDQLIERHQEVSYLSLRGAKSCQKKISSHIDDARLAKRLTEIVIDIPLENYDLTRKSIDTERIEKLFNYLKFGPLLRRKILELENI